MRPAVMFLQIIFFVYFLLKLLILLLSIVIGLSFLSSLRSFWVNIQAAKATRLHYVVVPYFIYNDISRVLCPPLLRLTNRFLPEASTASWRNLVGSIWPVKFRHGPFAALGTDNFLTVAPGGNILSTADASVIAQIFARPADFPKATQIYKTISIYGKNVVSADGPMWRRHRKLTAAAFTEKNNQLVWKTTLDRSQAMLSSWAALGGSCQTIQHVRHDTERLSLEVIGRAGLGHQLEWNESERDLPEGHTIGFTTAFQHISRNVIIIASMVRLFPKWFLKRSRSASLRKHYEAYDNWERYMEEMIATKKNVIKSEANETVTVDLLGQLIKGQDQPKVSTSPFSAPLTDSEVKGNFFLFIIAGHETSSSSIHLSILLLATNPRAQREVQKQLDNIFEGRSQEEWDYKKDFPRLLEGWLGAVMNEQLRLLSPTPTIPKVVCAEPQNIIIDNKEVTLPANTMIRLCTPSVHVNPKFWPHGPPKDPRTAMHDLEEFKPERWMTASNSNPFEGQSWTSDTPPKSPSPPFTPIKGSYFPFSDGQRNCLGKRFAQVAVLAALATIFSQYSVELDVSEFASDSEVSRMTAEQRKAVLEKVQEKAEWTWKNKMTCIITVQLTRDASVSLRLVKRGEERFFDL